MPLSHDESGVAALHCIKCDYELRGITTGVCPECGAAWSEETIKQATLDSWRTSNGMWVGPGVWTAVWGLAMGVGGVGKTAEVFLLALCTIAVFITSTRIYDLSLILARRWTRMRPAEPWSAASRALATALMLGLLFAAFIGGTLVEIIVGNSFF